MQRQCTGEDDTLTVRITDPETGDIHYEPCACGMVFDDVDRSVVHPHRLIEHRMSDAIGKILGS